MSTLPLSDFRAEYAIKERAARLRAACEALEATCVPNWSAYVAAMHSESDSSREWGLRWAANDVRRLVRDLSDGSDETRYAAALTARRALGKLWEVL